MTTNTPKPVQRLLDRAQKRFVRSRSGSVLILVVALLVLMALIGTAFMTMAQFDRASAVQHSFNTEVDLLLDGVINQVKGTITNDLYSSGQYRPAVIISTSQNQPVYYNTPLLPSSPRYWNGLGYDNGTAAVMGIQAGDAWLASRVPGLPTENGEPAPPGAPAPTGPATNTPLWPFISAPINGATAFDQPYWPLGPSGAPTRPTPLTVRAQLMPTYTQQTSNTATPPSLYIDGQVWPALETLTVTGGAATPTGNWWMAADADGDGIADSGLVKLLTLDGITYYAAVRIVDNAGAVNPSIALTPNPLSTYAPPNPSGTAGSMPGDLSPVNIDLEGMTVNPASSGSPPTYTSWTPPADLYQSLLPPNNTGLPSSPAYVGQGLLYNFRFNQAANGTPLSAIPATDIPGPTTSSRSDFLYYPYPYGYSNGATIYYYFDQQWLALGRRLSNPGFAVAQVATGSVNPNLLFQALPTTDSLAMAKHFVLRDPTVLSSATSPSVLEKTMPNTVYQSPYYNNASYTIPTTGGNYQYGYPTAPYLPSETLKWFAQNFEYWSDFDTSSTARTSPPQLTPTMPMRALFAPQNPVSNFAPNKFNFITSPSAGQIFNFGDVVATANGSKYVCIYPGTSTLPNTTYPDPTSSDPYWSDPYWAWEPWTNAPTKTSVNTGTFQQLYAAYWAVMADQYTPPTGTATGYWTPAFPATGSPSDYRMFRNPIRGGGTSGAATQPSDPQLGSQQVMELRAAIAAVNTMALRHGDAASITNYGTNDIISRTVYLPAQQTGGVAVQAQVYGVERQPYITQVYARNDVDPSNTWMAIELYNPYPNDIKMTNWTLATLNRSSPSNLTLSAIGTLQAQAGVTVIQAHQRIVLESSSTPPSSVVLPSPLPTGTSFVTCSGLSNAFGKELILMRPRRADGTLSAASPLPAQSNNYYQAESTSNPIDLIPIDSYDFTNMKQTAAAGSTQEWYYIRPSGTASSGVNKEWHMVYPGPWMLNSSSSTSGTGTGNGGGGGTGNGNGTGTGTASPPTWTGTKSTVPAPNSTTLTIGTPSATTMVPWANYHDTAIQMNNVDFGGPLKPTSGATNNPMPLGAFPRNGDILQVTFIGSYKLSPLGTPSTIYEMNPVTADSAMATACDSAADTQQPIVSQSTPQIIAENVGRFCPIDGTDATSAGATPAVDDFVLPVGGAPSATWRYHWAMRLFDFLTVQAPQDDYLPDVDPWLNDPASATTTATNYRYPAANSPPAPSSPPPVGYQPTYAPAPVANVTAGAKNAGLSTGNLTAPSTATSEDTAPVNGLVNINSAPWRVLAAIPWIPATQTGYRALNAQIAIGLVQYRDGGPGTAPHGPCRNLFELGEATLPTFGNKKLRDVLATANQTHFNLAQGNLTPIDGSTNGGNVQGDFQALFNTITRVSNLVTFRSDSYTAYVLIQGWQNAETPNPHLVVQRRAAVIIDRSVVTPNNRTPNATNVPQ